MERFITKNSPVDLDGKELQDGDIIRIEQQIVDTIIGINETIFVTSSVYYDEEDGFYKLSESKTPINIYDKFEIL